MLIKSGGFLRRYTTYPSGIAAGGGDTGFDPQAQKTLLTKRVEQAAQDVILPKGAIVLATVVLPDSESIATAGTVKIDEWNITTNAAVAAVLAASPATAYLNTPAASPLPLTADKRYRFTPASIPVGQSVVVGFEVILPRMRA